MDGMIPSTLEKTMLASSSTYARIQHALRQTTSAHGVPSSAYENQKTYIQEAEAKVDALSGAVKTAAEETRTKRAAFEKVRDSTGTKIADAVYALSRTRTRKRESYREKAASEEKAYVDALEAKMAVRGEQEEAERALGVGMDELDRLSQLSSEYTNLKSELWVLYDQIFINEDIPKDMQLRKHISEADKAYSRVADIASNESKTLRFLEDTESLVEKCKMYIDKALELCAWDVTGPSPMTDDMQHNYLSKAKEVADAATHRMSLFRRTPASNSNSSNRKSNSNDDSDSNDDLRRMSNAFPKIPIREARVEVFFMHPVYDLPSKEEVQTAAQGLDVFLTSFQTKRKASERRLNTVSSELEEAADVVNAARQELEVYRQGIFDAVLSGHARDDAPPAYSG